MNDNAVDFISNNVDNLSFRDVQTLVDLRKRFGGGKKNYVAKVRYVQLRMKHRRIQNLVSILKRNTGVYWSAIFRSIKQNDCTPQSFDFVEHYAITFLDKLLATGSSDASTVDKILKLYGFYCVSIHGYLSDEKLSLAFYSDIQPIFHSGSICNCGFNDNVTYFDENLLHFAMRANDLKFMTALLKYGINTPQNASYNVWTETAGELLFFWTRWLEPIGVTQSQSAEVWINVCQEMKGKKRGYGRFLLITKMLRILDIKLCSERKGGPDLAAAYTDEQLYDSVQCMKLYFRTTVEPLISKDDIVKFISSNPLWHGITEDFLTSVADHYENLFPVESNANYSPRTLQHLCRYSLRKSLTEKKVGVLPELVKNLNIPKRLKGYLLCEY